MDEKAGTGCCNCVDLENGEVENYLGYSSTLVVLYHLMQVSSVGPQYILIHI